jgi:uncharacterized SAM-binding protein YcdF (DUF218 family)
LSRRYRAAAVIAALVLLVIVGRLMAPLVGRGLIRSDPLARADAIVVLGSFRMERVAEAGMLFKEGWGTRIVLMRSFDYVNADLVRRLHVTVPPWIDLQRDVLVQMGVPAQAILQSDEPMENTKAEARWVANFARRSKWRRVLVVTSPYHTRRAGRYFTAAAGGSFQVVLHPNRFEIIDPDHWWRHRLDRYDVLSECLKLVYGELTPSPR